jgi:hypothetical protein
MQRGPFPAFQLCLSCFRVVLSSKQCMGQGPHLAHDPRLVLQLGHQSTLQLGQAARDLQQDAPQGF